VIKNASTPQKPVMCTTSCDLVHPLHAAKMAHLCTAVEGSVLVVPVLTCRMPLTMEPNFEDLSCRMVFGQAPPHCTRTPPSPSRVRGLPDRKRQGCIMFKASLSLLLVDPRADVRFCAQCTMLYVQYYCNNM